MAPLGRLPRLRSLAAAMVLLFGGTFVLVPVATLRSVGVAGAAEPSIAGPATAHRATADPGTTVAIPRFRLASLRPLPQPVEVRIPAIGVATDLSELGLRADRSIEVPDDPERAGWYRHRAVPGERGAGVIVGHVDGHTGPAVFFDLAQLDVGDRVSVARNDGSVAVFVVTSVESHRKDRFPTRRVYGPTDRHELRLVTCGGAFDEQQRSYEENVVVFAELVAIR